MKVQDLLSEDTAPLSPTTSTTSCSSASSTPVKRGWVAPFLLHLHQMLRHEDSRVIRWAEDGMAFQILDKHVMTTQILPKYFKNKNFASFQRQLNYFGFRKWSKARALFPTYGREHFTRDNFSEMSLVRRQCKKSRKRKYDEKLPPAKRTAVLLSSCGIERCTRILPRPDAAVGNFVMPPIPQSHKAQLVTPPVHPAPNFSLPRLSLALPMNTDNKLPSIRELSQSGALPHMVIGPLRPRLIV
ncbi:hsf-type dna-binding [Plasmopara halstedii]|uniref:Hsf-type dna-binding n=1 Tax=Plasmopara halstedii TaxID=4781 RepID=A0A0P1A6Q1_PLAHL|nr:hsf-type dna-binding [Plasmopara halstedii]CEG35848.1 hsf-type dna-binding [Plasmopara halstedii]|eukprot:XP_024572217.1 hsf-type dna-binding [Plasmopara halstedii]